VHCSVENAAVLYENHCESRQLELARLKKKDNFGRLATFLFGTFATLFSTTGCVVMETLKDERYVIMTYKLFFEIEIFCNRWQPHVENAIVEKNSIKVQGFSQMYSTAYVNLFYCNTPSICTLG